MHLIHEEIGADLLGPKGRARLDVRHPFVPVFRPVRAMPASRRFLWENYPDVPDDKIEAFQELTARFAEGG